MPSRYGTSLAAPNVPYVYVPTVEEATAEFESILAAKPCEKLDTFGHPDLEKAYLEWADKINSARTRLDMAKSASSVGWKPVGERTALEPPNPLPAPPQASSQPRGRKRPTLGQLLCDIRLRLEALDRCKTRPEWLKLRNNIYDLRRKLILRCEEEPHDGIEIPPKPHCPERFRIPPSHLPPSGNPVLDRRRERDRLKKREWHQKKKAEKAASKRVQAQEEKSA